MFELYSAFKVGNIKDFDNGKCSRSWGIVLCRFLFNSETSQLFQLAPKAKCSFQIHCHDCNFFSDFANVRASKIPKDQLKLLLILLVAK